MSCSFHSLVAQGPRFFGEISSGSTCGITESKWTNEAGEVKVVIIAYCNAAKLEIVKIRP